MILRHANKNLILGVATTLLVVLGFTLAYSPTKAGALSGSDFKAGNIIDDAVFYNSNSMNANQIQAFLDSKVPNCDTNGTKIYSGSTTRAQYGASRGYPAPYTCLKNYTQTIPTVTNGGSDLCKNSIQGGTKSAAQIILDSAKACGINPQVLIVMLQKEQSLITDEWPWTIQYNTAMGYACPDSGPNNSANCDSEYFGFFNQVYNAAKAFRRYEANPNSYNYRKHRSNFILYNPNTSCGGSNVFIANQATASLYIYTPYQPNQSSLDNLYGSGDGCGAYGNRNFWRMFNDWFGPTTGSLIRTETSSSLYYTDGSRKHPVPSMAIAGEFGLSLGDVRFVTQQEIDSIPNSSAPYSSSIGRLVKTPDASTVYLVSAGYKFPISSWSTLVNFGFDGDDIRIMSEDAISRLITSPKNLSDLVRGFSNGTSYKIENGKKRVIFELSKLNELNSTNNLSKISDFALNQISYGTPVVDGDYVIKSGNSIRLYDNNGFMNVNSINVYKCNSLASIKTFEVNSYSMTNGTPNGTLSCIVEDSIGTGYVMNYNSKIQLPSGHLLATSKPSDSFINSFSTSTIKPVLKGDSGRTLSILENGKLRSIPSMTVFSNLGYSSSDILNIPSAAFNSIPVGSMILAPGSTVKISGSNTIYVITDSTSKLSVPSAGYFNALGYNWNSLITIDQLTSNTYLSSGGMPSLFKTSITNYIYESGTLYTISPSVAAQYGINLGSLAQLDDAITANANASVFTRFIKSSNSSTIYYIESGQKRPISSWESLISLGGSGNIITLSNNFISTLPTGSSI